MQGQAPAPALQEPQQAPQDLVAPQALATLAASGSQLPEAPPPRPSIWDKKHASDTWLALGSGLLSGFNFGDGLANAGKALMARNQQLHAEQIKDHQFGGPDNVFDITTDPTTGERTVKPVPMFQAYLAKKALKAKDAADINGRAMFALQNLPPDQREAAYQQMRANPSYFGVDASRMPEHYDPNYAAVTSGMGMTVSQALTREQAATNSDRLQEYRGDVQSDRDRRTTIYGDRSAATIRQGDARVAQGAERVAQGDQRIAISKSKGAGGSGGRMVGGLDPRYEYRVGPNGTVQKRLKKQ